MQICTLYTLYKNCEQGSQLPVESFLIFSLMKVCFCCNKNVCLIFTVFSGLTLSFFICYKGTVNSGQIHTPYCSITDWSKWGSIQLHWPHNWSRPLCCGKHFTRLASILINSLLLIMYLIDQFGPWVNWSIILIFFFPFFLACGVKWGADCSGWC